MKEIRIEKQGPVLQLVLNRPGVRNAFEPEMIREITYAFQHLIPSDQEARVVLLRGEGPSFCAGADLGWMQSMAKFNKAENLKDSENLFAMFEAIRSCRLPVVGQVHGHVMGGGVGLVACCDIVAAELKTEFAFSEVRLGISPAVISPFVLEKMSFSFASRLMLTGEVFTSEMALISGLVHHVGDQNSIESFVSMTLKNLCANGPEAVQATKALIRFQSQKQIMARDELRKETTSVIAERRVSAEGQEGLRAFFEKRSPAWKVRL